jgi:hypothetical protein
LTETDEYIYLQHPQKRQTATRVTSLIHFKLYRKETDGYIYMILYVLGFMVFNATFINSAVISWWSVLLAEETGVPRENRRPAVSH